MGKFSEYKLPLKSLAEGTHEFHYDVNQQLFKDMESADIRDANVSVDLTVTHRNGAYKLDFYFNGTIIVACDRCLDDMDLAVDTEYHITVKYGDSYKDDSDEFIEIPECDNFINVAYMIFDTISLAVPIKHVHPQGKCNKTMSSLLKKHRSYVNDDPDADFDEEFIDDVEDGGIDEGYTSDNDQTPTDPRWDALKNLGK